MPAQPGHLRPRCQRHRTTHTSPSHLRSARSSSGNPNGGGSSGLGLRDRAATSGCAPPARGLQLPALAGERAATAGGPPAATAGGAHAARRPRPHLRALALAPGHCCAGGGPAQKANASGGGAVGAAMLPSMMLQGAPLCCRKAAARREALVDGSAACDPGTPGSVWWCGQAKGMAAIRYHAAQCSRRQQDLTRWHGRIRRGGSVQNGSR